MTSPTFGLFNSVRVNGIMQGVADPRLLDPPLVWNMRVPDVPAAEEEILAKFDGQILIADIIADDAQAVVYDSGRFQFQTTKVPNLKMGISMNQSMVATLNRIQQMGGVPNDDVQVFNSWLVRNVTNVRQGVQLRKEVLKLAMLLDGLSYDRLGIKMSNVTFGMYTDLKVTVSTAWSNTASTPITDIQTVRRIALQRYGIDLNRATLSYAAFMAMVATTEFQTQSKLYGWGLITGTPGPAAPIQSDRIMLTLLERMLSGGGALSQFTIEIDDRRYYSQNNAGAITNARIHPIDKVLLTNAANDGNANAYDFANGVVTESIIGNLVPGNVIGNIPVGRGPIAYTTLANPQLNPPGLVTWGVARGMPRKHMNQASGVLSVGTLSETISATLPDPL